MNTFESIEIELDRKRSMILDHYALMLAERELNKFRGVSDPSKYLPLDLVFFRAIETAQGNSIATLPYDLTNVLLWAALLREDPQITIEQVGRLITNRVEVTRKLIEVWQRTWPKADDSVEEEATGERPLDQRPTSNGKVTP